MPDPDREKTELRRRIRADVAALDPARAAAWSDRICFEIEESGLLDGIGVAMLFTPLIRVDGSREPDILPLAAACEKRGVHVLLPRVEWANRRIEPVRVHDLERDLMETRNGLREPRPELPGSAPGEADVILVPGLAFDRSGNRLGHGLGFYDRFLSDPAVRGLRVGVAFEIQVVELVPHTRQDVPMQMLATERAIHRIASADGPRAGP